MCEVAGHSLFGNKQQLNTNKLFSNVQLRKDYIVIKDVKEDGETKCEKANSQRAPVGISTVHSSTCKHCTETQSETVCHLVRKGCPSIEYNTKALL